MQSCEAPAPLGDRGSDLIWRRADGPCWLGCAPSILKMSDRLLECVKGVPATWTPDLSAEPDSTHHHQEERS